jgi:hypothetical protein
MPSVRLYCRAQLADTHTPEPDNALLPSTIRAPIDGEVTYGDTSVSLDYISHVLGPTGKSSGTDRQSASISLPECWWSFSRPHGDGT